MSLVRNWLFDPSKSPHYKVVLVRYSFVEDSGRYYDMDINSSETASWKHMFVPVPQGDLDTGPHGDSYTERVFWNGARVIHWMSQQNIHI